MRRYAGIALLALAGGCGEDELPAGYLRVERIELTGAAATDRPVELAAVRVVDGPEALGVYPLPARIPVSADGSAREIRLEPMVRRAGLASLLTVYPMYEAAFAAVPTAIGAERVVEPEVRYAASVTELVRDDVTAGGASVFSVDVDGDADTALEPVRGEGGGALARAELTAAAPLLEAATPPIATTLPADDIRELWLELDYRGDVALQVALLPEALGTPGERGARYLQGAFGRDEFERFYFDLGDDLGDGLLAAGRWRIGILAAYEETGPSVQRVEIDNVRLLVR